MSPATALLTRMSKDDGRLRIALEQLGLKVLEASAILTVPPRDESRLRQHLDRLADYDWLILTSATGVEACFRGPRASTIPERVRIGVVGPVTAAALRPLGREPDFIPSEFTTDALASQLPTPAKRRILLLRAEVSNPALPGILQERGGIVDDVAAYRTIPDRTLGEQVQRWNQAAPHWVVFASPSAVKALHDALPSHHSIRTQAQIACIGPVTAGAARRFGFRVIVEAQPHTVEGIAQGIREAMRHA